MLQGWFDYYLAEPFGDERADIRIAYAAAGLASCLAEKKDKSAWTAEDFMPNYSDVHKTKEVVSPDQQFKKLLAINALFGGTYEDLRG